MAKLKQILFMVCMVMSHSALSADREETVCGWFKERFLFLIWSSAAPEPDESRFVGHQLVISVDFTTSDKIILRGYKYPSHDMNDAITEPKGYVLMALGNAMISDQVIGGLKSFSQKGYDVYIFDYRGYGLSGGKRRIKAIIEDYKELANYLNAQYQTSLLYGISLGGAVIANVIGAGVEYDRAVIDSSPSRFSPYGCPKEIDPAENIPVNAGNMLVITGVLDQTLSSKMTAEYRELASIKGASVFDGPDYAHPFMDGSSEVHHDRLSKIINFLDDQEVD